MTRTFVRRLFSPAGRLVLAGLALPAAASPAHAAGPAVPVGTAWWWSWLGYFSNAGSRGNVLTLCVLIFCLSLFILLGATKR